VGSYSAVKLITRAFAELAGDRTVGRAEALRRSMLTLVQTGTEFDAQPLKWAPFMVVGDGGMESQ
jgi:CHAT domain-containing protein